MPQLIEHIDAIARQSGRAVLYLEFHPPGQWRGYRYMNDPARTAALAWLNANGIGWQPCGPFADPPNMLPWLGQVALDVPYDPTLARYQMLRDEFQAIFVGARARGAAAPMIEPISTADYPTPARRPANSLLAHDAICAAYGIIPRPWTAALDDILDELIGPKQ